MTSTELFPPTDLIVGAAPGANPTAVVGASDAGVRGGYITGADALVWYSAALAADDLVLAVWPSPELPVVIYGGDESTLVDRLRNGTLVLVSGGHSSLDAGPVVHTRTETPDAAIELFGFDGIATTSEDPLAAAIRRFGDPTQASELFALNGATVTIRVPDQGAIANELAGRFGFAVSRIPSAPVGPSLLARVAWTRALGAFQVIDDPDVATAAGALLESDEPTAVLVARDAAPAAVSALLTDGGQPDIVLSGGPGGPRAIFDDLTLVLGGGGAVVLTGHTVPPRDTVVVRGEAAAALTTTVAAGGLARRAEHNDAVTLGPAPAEDRDRWLAHSWARSQRVWAGEPGSGGPDLATEAIAIGAVPLTDDHLDPVQPAGIVSRVAVARDWHPIDPTLHAALEPIAIAVTDQAAGGERDLSPEELATLVSYANEPGMWLRLPAAYHRTDTAGPPMFEFPFPTPTVELLRAAVAAEGNAAELRRLIGPIKVALRSGFRGRRAHTDGEGDA